MQELLTWIWAHIADDRVVLGLMGIALDIWWRRCTPESWSQWWTAALGLGMGVLGAWMMEADRAQGFAFGWIGFGFGLLWGGILLVVAKKHGQKWLGICPEKGTP